jgi:hypothetical protein
MTSILGLPAHPLFAHIPVVLIPLAAIGAVAMLWPSVRDRLGWVVVGLVFVSGIFTQLAITSGQNLEEYLKNESQLARDHVKMGESLRPWVLLMFLALLGVMVVAHLARRHAAADGAEPDAAATKTRDRLKYAGIAAMVLSLLFSALATFSIIRIGHSGSKAVWNATQKRIDKGTKESGGGGESDTGG